MNACSCSLAFFLFVGISVHAQDRSALRDSLKQADKALSAYPDSMELRMRKAAWNMQLEEWEYAKDEYDVVLRHHSSHLPALFFRAYANEKLQRFAFAHADYVQLLSLEPSHFQARLGLALLCQKEHRYTEAIDQINILIEQHPDSAIAYAARAGLEQERGMEDLSIFDFSEAIRLEPRNIDYLLSRADLYIRRKQYSKAKDDLERIISLGVTKASLVDFYNRIPKKK